MFIYVGCVIFDSSHPGRNKYLCPSKRGILTRNEDRSTGFQERPAGKGKGSVGSGQNTRSPEAAETSARSRPMGGRGRLWPEGHLQLQNVLSWLLAHKTFV